MALRKRPEQRSQLTAESVWSPSCFRPALSCGWAQNSECVEQGQLKETRLCNQETGTWWIDLDLDKPDCSPACVVDVSEKTAEINWRCTGLVPPSPTASGAPRYEVTVHFNTLVTQDDIDEAAVLLGDYDHDLEFLIMESFPPIGRALLATNAPQFCSMAEAQLEAKSYVDDVSCQGREEPDPGEQDIPIQDDAQRRPA